MNYLAIDTASESLKVLVSFGGRRGYYECGDFTAASVRLMPEVDRLLGECGAKLSDMDFFACVTGPGSFTGIRIGLATVKAFAYVCGKPTVGVTALELLAYNCKGEDPCVAVCDASNGMRYVAVYDGAMRELLSPRAISSDELDAFLAEIEEPHALVSDKRSSAGINSFVPENSGDAFAALVEAHAAEAADGNALVPLYIRKPQAERDLEKRNGTAGD